MEIEQEPPAIGEKRPASNVSIFFITPFKKAYPNPTFLSSKWPDQGAIEVIDLEARYAADLNPVLRGLNFTVKPREKVGVVGRTGSGKSTLALSIFRFIELSKGKIVIDGIDISEIGTDDLRGNLTIIPQGNYWTIFIFSIVHQLKKHSKCRSRFVFWYTSIKHGSIPSV